MAVALGQKYLLARDLVGHNTLGMQAVKCVCTGQLLALRRIAKDEITEEIVRRVLESVVTKYNQEAQESFLYTFCELVLDGFSESEIGALRNGSDNTELKGRFQGALQRNHEAVRDTTIAKVQQMQERMIPDIVAAFEREGIRFPERKSGGSDGN